MNINLYSLSLILYHEEKSEIFSFETLPGYKDIMKLKCEFLGSYIQQGIKDERSFIYQNIKRETFTINDEESYNKFSELIKIQKINKIQLYITNTSIYPTELIPDNQHDEVPDDVKKFNDIINKNNDIQSEEIRSTSQMSSKNVNEKYGIKKSEKHIKAMFVWARVAKSMLEKNDRRLYSDDGTRRYNICTNVSNKNVSLVVNDVNTKKKIKSKQILIYRNSFNFNWSNEEGGEKLKNLILYLIQNFHLIDSFHDISHY